MPPLIREIRLENGLTIHIYDHTRHYFGDFYLVKLEIACEVPLGAALFADEAELEDARRLLGDPAVYRRTVEQMGVPSTAIETVTERLIGTFTDHSLPYFSSPVFSARFVKAELARARKKAAHAPRFTAGPND